MNVSDALRKRRTVRGFLPDPVPDELIREIVDLARQAPSNSNTQPWHIAVVSGEARHRLQKDIAALTSEGRAPNPEFPAGGVGLKDVYKQRQYECAYRYYDAMGIARDDKEKRMALVLKNWEFFGAPHAAFISMPRTMHRANAIDIGIFLQTLMLLMTERGISSCPQGALASYPDPVRAIAPIPDGNALMCGLSFGYADPDHPSAKAEMPREPLEVIASFTAD